MTLDEFVRHLQGLQLRGYGNLPVFALDGASGVTSELGHPFVREVKGREDGAVADLPVGTQYISVSAGN